MIACGLINPATFTSNNPDTVYWDQVIEQDPSNAEAYYPRAQIIYDATTPKGSAEAYAVPQTGVTDKWGAANRHQRDGENKRMTRDQVGARGSLSLRSNCGDESPQIKTPQFPGQSRVRGNIRKGPASAAT